MVVMTKTKMRIEVYRLVGILAHGMIPPHVENQPLIGTGKGMDLNAGRKNVARNGAAGAPGETATRITITIGRTTLGEAEAIGNGLTEIGEIMTRIDRGERGKMPTGTVAVKRAGAGEQAVNCLWTCCMTRRSRR